MEACVYAASLGLLIYMVWRCAEANLEAVGEATVWWLKSFLLAQVWEVFILIYCYYCCGKCCMYM